MKILVVREPWIYALRHGKPVENRSRRTHYRGPLLLSASKKLDDDFPSCANYCLERGLRIPGPHTYKLGGIVAIADLVECVDDHPSRWFEGDFAWVLKNVRELPFTPIKGQLGIFSPTAEVLRKLKGHI